jgi:hypothetical protein
MQEAQCQECHAMADPALVAGYNASAHKGGESFESSCAGCHGGSAAAANHPANKTYSTINSVTFVATADIIGGQGTNVAAGTVFCLSCHKGQYPPPHTTDSTQLTTTCANCHTASGTGDAHFIQASGPVTTTLTTCTPCHLNADKTAYVTPAQVDATCAGCHTSSTPHAFQKTTTTSCVVCHLNAINHPGATVADKNDGVRAITGEFQQWSHHIINDINNSQTPRDAQCIMCHLEGKVVNGAVVPDATVHMTNKTIHLRNGNTGIQSASAEYNWDPKSPSHTNMDKFCMSCHNAAGAVTAFANVSSGLKHMTAVPGASAASPLNPFGDLIQNNYDGLSRGAVVAVFDQFDPSNTSHHAVRAARYTASTAGTPGALSSAFSNISASNAAAPAPYTGTNLRYATGTSYVGTMSDTGKFITAYKPLVDNNGTFAPLADNSQLHCGDCHTVGQWAARGSAGFTAYSTAFGAGVTKYYQTQIGAHGSGNEYMLRNSDGNNSLNPMSLVCYNCHAASLYGSGVSSTSVVSTKLFVTSGVGPNGPLNGGAKNPLVSWTLYNYTGVRSAAAPFNGYGLLNNTAGVKNVTTGAISTANAHDGVAGTLGNVHCNDDMNNTAGLTGLARLNSANKTAAAFGQYTNGHYGNGGGANAFGIKCSNCHNSGDGTNAGYGGIHGNAFRVGNTATVITNAAYTTYSSTTAGTGTGAAWATTSHQPYRFLPGLGNFRYNGGSDWTLSKFAVSGRSGCYTLNGSSLSTGPTKIKNAATGRYTSTNMVGNDNGLLGTWGACTEHTNNDHVPTRNILRPTTY